MELADFDYNARHKTKLPPPYEETHYAMVQVPNQSRQDEYI